MGILKSIKKGFKKIGKGIKSGVKGIVKGVKSAVGKVGKWMGKLGIVGQLALMFTPLGPMLMSGISSAFGAIVGTAGTAATAGSGLLGSSLGIVRSAGQVLKAAGSFASSASSAFSTITDGITNFIGEFSKVALKKIPGMSKAFPKFLGSTAPDTFFTGANSAWSKVSTNFSNNVAAMTKSFSAGVENLGNVGKAYSTAPPATGTPVTAAQKSYAKQQTAKSAQRVADAQSESLLSNQKPVVDATATPDVSSIDSSSIDVTKPNIDVSKIETPNIGEGTYKKSFAAKTGQYVRELPGTIADATAEQYAEFLDGRSLTKAVVQEGGEKVFDSVVEGVSGGIKTGVGNKIIDKIDPVEEQFNTYMANYEAATVGQYNSPQVNDRAMAISLNPQQYMDTHPWGASSNLYQQRMQLQQGGIA